jgi:ABC-type multidrug transport system ATPase subunit
MAIDAAGLEVWPADASNALRTVELEGVVSIVDDFPVLTGVDLAVERAQVVLVSGPNGAGKTSLLRLLAGLIPVTSGRAIVLGQNLADDGRAHRARLAFVAQDSACYDDLSVRRNIRLHARAAGVPIEHAERVMVALDLEALAGVPHAKLSTGQRRRCALAVGLARQAELLLLDEPHAGLDVAARDLVDDAIRGAAAAGVTVLLVSHELDRALELADRHVRLAGGAVVQRF